MADLDRTEEGPAHVLNCPCGEVLTGRDEDELVLNAVAHLEAEHPDRAGKYGRTDILFMAQLSAPGRAAS